ncbi:MAG TPA: helix-turn-helix transcriptional regulator [Candidatus Saccharimonadales bacterium]|nr:helix-turn-helix transcriptional regulator [Candidatus Saccharimonadales bacterium]
MRNKLIYTFQDHLKESLKDASFKKAWEESEVEYELAKELIEARLNQKLSQRDLAEKVHTSQSAISRIEAMRGNPSLFLLKRLAKALDLKLSISLAK